MTFPPSIRSRQVRRGDSREKLAPTEDTAVAYWLNFQVEPTHSPLVKSARLEKESRWASCPPSLDMVEIVRPDEAIHW